MHIMLGSNAVKRDESDHIDAESATTPSVMGRPRRTEAERKAWLEADSRLEEVRPDQVKCRTCKKWIKLSTKRLYATYHWQKHRERCKIAMYVSLKRVRYSFESELQAKQPCGDCRKENTPSERCTSKVFRYSTGGMLAVWGYDRFGRGQ